MRKAAMCEIMPIGSVLHGTIKWRGDVWEVGGSRRLLDVTRVYTTRAEVKAEAERIAARDDRVLLYA